MGQDDRDGPWEADLCFTLRAENADAVSDAADKLDAVARRLGQEAGFSDYEGPQPTTREDD